jgi:A/G-specific adenine glycosylase
LSGLRARLLAWYDQGHRDLPWRREPTPWRVWVSEIMLQQTRVESVIPYFHRFLARFPDPTTLAAAPLEEVLTLWAGLGYYSRARSLHTAAGQVVERHGGEIPNDPEAFRALAGVGPYTCGAVMSIAFGRPEPVVDGNVVRVLCRLDRIEEDPQAPAVVRHLWRRAGELAAGERPGDLNQALMELGAVVCRPQNPTCLLCPLAADCAARAGGCQEALPRKAPRAARPTIQWIAGLARTPEGHVWLARRAGTGLLGGLWELPAGLTTAPGLTLGPVVATVTHAFTHRVWQITVHTAEGTPEITSDYDDLRAVPADALASVALSGPGIKALRAAGLAVAHRRGAGSKKVSDSEEMG